jgi:DNA-binding protein HU-beta
LGVVFASLRGTSDGKAPKPALCRLTDRSQAFGNHVFGNHVFGNHKDTRMSKKDLIEAVAVKTDMTRDKATVAVDAIIAHIEDSMKKGEEVRIPGFGTFKVAQRAARKARNPQTGVEMDVKAARVPKFQASKTLKELLN